MPIERVGGVWSRSGVDTEKGLDWDGGNYPQKVKLPLHLEKHIQSARDPRVALTFVNGPYELDPTGRDVWISSFKTGKGDCDSKAISASDICYSYMRREWIPCIAMGHAWLSSKDNPSERAKIAHAYNVFVSRTSDDVVIGEPTYLVKGFDDMGPGSGHIIEVKYVLSPGASIKVNATHDMGKEVPIHTRNDVLIDAIERETSAIKDELNRRYDDYVSPLPPVELVEIGRNKNGMPILQIGEKSFVNESKRVQ